MNYIYSSGWCCSCRDFFSSSACDCVVACIIVIYTYFCFFHMIYTHDFKCNLTWKLSIITYPSRGMSAMTTTATAAVAAAELLCIQRIVLRTHFLSSVYETFCSVVFHLFSLLLLFIPNVCFTKWEKRKQLCLQFMHTKHLRIFLSSSFSPSYTLLFMRYI